MQHDPRGSADDLAFTYDGLDRVMGLQAQNSPKRWNSLTYEEQQDAIEYIERVGGFR